MQTELRAITAGEPLHSMGTEAYYRHTRDDFLEPEYEAAASRIRAALAAERA